MDQIKPILQGLVQYRFWVIVGIVIPVLIVGWLMTANRLSGETADGVTRIDSALGSVNQVMQVQNHPNPVSEKGMEANIQKLTLEVKNAWERQYRRQQGILVWPRPTPEWDEFIRHVDVYRPIEKFPFPGTKEDEIPIRYRELYRNYIKEELPKLAEKIGAKWQAKAGGGGMGGGEGESEFGFPGGGAAMLGAETEGEEFGGGALGMGALGIGGQQPEEEEGIIVRWSSQDQSNLQNSRFDWSHNPRPPRTVDILYAQEDLWVLNALMDIIARTNYDATANYNATVKEIQYIAMGATVGQSTGQVSRVSGRALGSSEGGGDMGMGMGMGGSSGMEDMMGGGEEGGGFDGMGDDVEGEGDTMGSAVRVVDPAHNRYVDNSYQPVPATDLRSAITSSTQDPTKAQLVVAKRIPLRLGLVVDQRRLHRFITECGNANLMVEVRQVRVNRIGTASRSTGGGAGMGFGESEFGGFGGMETESESDGGGGFGGMGGMGGMPGMPGGGLGGGTEAALDQNPHDIPVEVYGMIYIYNPVNTDKLGVEQVAAGDNPLEQTTTDTGDTQGETGQPADSRASESGEASDDGSQAEDEDATAATGAAAAE